MGVKGDNLEINSGIILPSFILTYMVIRVKKKSWNKKKKKETERERENGRTREERTKRKQKTLEK